MKILQTTIAAVVLVGCGWQSIHEATGSGNIEAGIDYKVIAGWLGHKDGGILVAKTYGHLRDTHSFEMAKRMTQGADEVEPKNVVNISDKTA